MNKDSQISQTSGRSTENFDIAVTTEEKTKGMDALREKVSQANDAQKDLILSQTFETFYELNGYMGDSLYSRTLDVEEQMAHILAIANDDLSVKISDIIHSSVNIHGNLINEEVDYALGADSEKKGELHLLSTTLMATSFFSEDVVKEFVREKGIFESEEHKENVVDDIRIWLVGANSHDRGFSLHTNSGQENENAKPFKFKELLGGLDTGGAISMDIFKKDVVQYEDGNGEFQEAFTMFNDTEPFDSADYGDYYGDNSVRDVLNKRLYEELVSFIHDKSNPMELTLTLERDLVPADTIKYIQELEKPNLLKLKKDLKEQIKRAEKNENTDQLESLEEEMKHTRKALKRLDKGSGKGMKP